MFTRIIFIVLVALLAAPTGMLTRPPEAGQQHWSSIVEAKKGHRQKKKCKPAPQPSRPSLTQTFLTSDPIAVPGAPGASKGPAAPYPSTIVVTGFANGAITDVDLLLLDISHPVPMDIDILLAAPDGSSALVMSDVGRIFPVTNVDLTLDDDATTALSQSELEKGAFRPTDISSAGDVPDVFDAPAPALAGNIALSAFNGGDPNGTWQLWVMDDTSGDAGTIGGWALRVTAKVDGASTAARAAAKHAQHDAKTEKKRRKCKQ